MNVQEEEEEEDTTNPNPNPKTCTSKDPTYLYSAVFVLVSELRKIEGCDIGQLPH